MAATIKIKTEESSLDTDVDQELRQLALERIQQNQKTKQLKFELRKSNYSGKMSKTAKNSTIKKVNAFLRKLKAINDYATNVDLFCEELQQLKLSKYISEIVSIIADLKFSRKTGVAALLKVCSLLHTEYDDFSPLLEAKLLKSIDEEFYKLRKVNEAELDLILKKFGQSQSKNLRMVTEMTFVGVFENDALLVDLINSLLKKERNNDRIFLIPSLIANFVKYAGQECTGRLSKDLKSDYKLCGLKYEKKVGLLEETTRLELEKIIKTQYSKLSKKLLDIFEFKKEKEIENTEHLKTKGSLSEKRLLRLKQYNDAFNKLYSIVLSMSNSLELKMPPVDATDMEEDILERLKRNITKDSKEVLFDDEETRAFYEDLPDLSMYRKTTTEKEAELEKSCEEAGNSKDDKNIESDGNTKHPLEMKISEGPIINSKNKKKVGFALLLEDLASAASKTKIDAISERFCAFNNKKNKDALVEFVLKLKKKQLSFIMYYSRLIASLSKIFPEIKDQIIEILEKRFYGMFLNKGQLNLDEKFKNIAFIAELTKFGIFPIGSVLKIISDCFNDFSPHSIQVACDLLENCGRWLYKNPLTHDNLESQFKKVNEKIKNTYLDESMKSLIQMAFYQCCPAPLKKKTLVLLPPEKAFVLHVLLEYLDEENANDALRLIRKMNWGDPDMSTFIRQTFFQIVSFSFEKLPLVASLIGALDKYHNIGVHLIDDVLEEIRLGLEDNKVFQVQRRIAFVRFLGELYVYKMINSHTIFDVLYLLITFKKKDESKKQEVRDESSDDFRIKLVCCLLDSCGKYFRLGALKRRLNRFLIYFQRFVYVTNLQNPIDLDVEFQIEEMFDNLGSKVERLENYEKIKNKIKELENLSSGTWHRDQLIAKDDWENYISLENIYIDEDDEANEKEREISSEEETEESEETLDESASDNEADWKKKNKKSEEDILFEKEFDNILKESIELRKHETKAISMNDSSSYAQLKTTEKFGSGKISLLTKRRNDQKPVLKELSLTVNEAMFVITEEDQKKKEEQKIIKETVLKGILQSEMEKRKKRLLSDEDSN